MSTITLYPFLIRAELLRVLGVVFKNLILRNNALSGAAAIIGKHTGEILFLGVKNKYCFICARAEKQKVDPSEHKCFKNYSGPSTNMESEIIENPSRI